MNYAYLFFILWFGFSAGLSFMIWKLSYPQLKKYYQWRWGKKEDLERWEQLARPSFSYWFFPKFIIPILLVSVIAGYFLVYFLFVFI